jgi:hypothetical protein
MHCPNCGHDVVGAEVDEVVFCPRCRNKFRNDQLLHNGLPGSSRKLAENEEKLPFGALRTMATVYGVLGIIVMILVAVFVYLGIISKSGPIPFGLIGTLAVGLGGLILAVGLLASSDLLRLMLSLEANTRQTAKLLAQRADLSK